jgi:FkbM family methyltransferase
MSYIFVIGPCWNNLQTLLNTINNNKSLIPNIKQFYIPTNDINVHNYFCDLNDSTIVSHYFGENEGHQTSCFNAIISGMKMVIEHQDENEDDIVIFSHEDVYINDINLFNNAINKFQKGYDIVCRIYTGTKKGETLDYYMNDGFYIRKKIIKKIFEQESMKSILPGNFCEKEFTRIITGSNIFSIPYYLHSTHKDSELGFYHILNYDIGNIPFWDKSNIEEILSGYGNGFDSDKITELEKNVNTEKGVFYNNSFIIPPIIIVCYNNYKYVENTLNQLAKINKDYLNYVHILDNCSNCKDTINYLNYLNNLHCKVIYNSTNNGPRISPFNNIELYNQLPDKFIITDPDLEFNENLPNNFIEILVSLSDKYNCAKIGFALDISDFDKMYQDIYYENTTIYDWEKKYWIDKINDTDFELYNAPVDTTFSLINKTISIFGSNIRIAGNFTAKHIPWYTNNKIYSVYENYIANTITTSISTTSKIILSYINNTYLKINKNNELFLIENKADDVNLSFWKNNFTNWQHESFDIFDKYLDKNKIFIDIGGWIGTTSLYGSRKSKHVYSVEADTNSFNIITRNMQINCNNKYTLINKAIFNADSIEIKFGKNNFVNDSKMNDSTSHIYNDNETSSEYYSIQTITLHTLLENNNINPMEISLIKVDIEGGEENILNDLYDIHLQYNTRLYISFHYSCWKDKNLNRFTFLTEEQKQNIINHPFTSLLF